PDCRASQLTIERGVLENHRMALLRRCIDQQPLVGYPGRRRLSFYSLHDITGEPEAVTDRIEPVNLRNRKAGGPNRSRRRKLVGERLLPEQADAMTVPGDQPLLP